MGGEYTEGYCNTCPMFENEEPDPTGCFFERGNNNIVSWITPAAVESCAKACDETTVSDACNFCPSKVSALDFGVKDKADQCYFAPTMMSSIPTNLFHCLVRASHVGLYRHSSNVWKFTRILLTAISYRP